LAGVCDQTRYAAMTSWRQREWWHQLNNEASGGRCPILDADSGRKLAAKAAFSVDNKLDTKCVTSKATQSGRNGRVVQRKDGKVS